MAKVKKHTPEFNDNAVKKVLEQKKPKAQAERSLGNSCSILDQWISRFEEEDSIEYDSALARRYQMSCI